MLLGGVQRRFHRHGEVVVIVFAAERPLDVLQGSLRRAPTKCELSTCSGLLSGSSFLHTAYS